MVNLTGTLGEYRFFPAIMLLLVSGISLMNGDVRAANEFVNYEDFGAKGDGKADDFEALVKAHEYANQHGRTVKVNDGKSYYIGGADRTISIRTNTDFGKARFIIDDTELENYKASVFKVESDLEPFKIKGVKSLSVGQRKIDVKLPGSCVITVKDDNVKRFIRRGGNQNNGSPQTDTFLVDKRGNIDPNTPVIWEFKQLTSLVAMPMDKSTLTLRGGIFTTIANSTESTGYHARGIAIERSNVVIEGLQHHIAGEGKHGPPYRGFIRVSGCANVVIKDTILSGHKTYYKIGSAGRRVPMGSYDISIEKSLNISLVNVTQFNDIMDRNYWGIIGTNFCKNLSYDGCKLSRFDAHQGVTNATVRNSTIGHMGVLLTGFGEFLIENSTVQSRRFIGLRQDYGSTWKGDIIIRNCRFIPQKGGALIEGSNDGQHDFGYTCYMPERLLIDGLKIEDGKPSDRGKGPVIFSDFSPRFKNADYKQKFPYVITREVHIRNVSTTSGKLLQLSDNKFMFNKVKVHGLAR